LTKDLVDKGAPWNSGMPWTIVLIQGVVLGIAGLIMWLAPSFGALAVLQVLAIVLLATAALSVWRLLRNRVAPARTATVAFRAGLGMSVGLIAVIGSLIVKDRDIATVAMAIVLGIGLVLYGLAAAATALTRRGSGSSFPVVALIISAAAVVVGVLLVINGRDGADALRGTFALLGVLLLVAGLALIGYALYLRSNGQTAVRDD